MWYSGYALYSSDFDTINLYFNQFTQGIKSMSYSYYYKYVRIPTAIDNLSTNASLLNIYPNPCKDNLNCTLPSVIKGDDLKLSLFNTLGELEYCTIISSRDINKEVTINTAHLSPGAYIVLVSDGISNYTRKFIKE
jgi:hypothetical protein